MKKHVVTIPEVGLIALTRAMLGAGIAFLVSDKLTAEHRRAIGWTLVAVGVLTTVPLALEVFSDDQWTLPIDDSAKSKERSARHREFVRSSNKGLA